MTSVKNGIGDLKELLWDAPYGPCPVSVRPLLSKCPKPFSDTEAANALRMVATLRD